MRFEDMNWFDLENYLKLDNRIILIFGSCEQHGYLSLCTDVKIPLALADAARKLTGVPSAPTINFGVSPYFMDYPGTISLRASTLMDLAEDIVKSVYRHGFKRILILNGHGGNETIRSRLYEISNQFTDLKLAWYSWWQSHSIEIIATQHNLKPAHGSWLEAFSFTTVSELPLSVKTPPHVPGLLNAQKTREVYGDGNFGGPYIVDKKIMDEIFDAATKDVLHLLKFDD